VPLKTPAELRDNPEGSPVWLQVYGELPPLCWRVVEGYATLIVPLGSDVVVIVKPATIVSE
jgi:hypothetical protein